jgi:hypothetical protein
MDKKGSRKRAQPQQLQQQQQQQQKRKKKSLVGNFLSDMVESVIKAELKKHLSSQRG